MGKQQISLFTWTRHSKRYTKGSRFEWLRTPMYDLILINLFGLEWLFTCCLITLPALTCPVRQKTINTDPAMVLLIGITKPIRWKGVNEYKYSWYFLQLNGRHMAYCACNFYLIVLFRPPIKSCIDWKWLTYIFYIEFCTRVKTARFWSIC